MREQSDPKPIAESLAMELAGLSVTSKKETKTCPDCGTEYSATVYTNTKTGTLYICPEECALCGKRKEAERKQAEAEAFWQRRSKEVRECWRAQCGPQGLFGAKTFSNFNRTRQPAAFKAVHPWKGKSVILYSPGPDRDHPLYGVGKSHLVAALANELIDNSPTSGIAPVYFTTEQKLMERITTTFKDSPYGQEAFSPQETEAAIYRSLLNDFRLLIIDDVGKKRPRDISFTQQVYFRLIDDRYTQGKPIILTTNLNLEELEQHIGGACGDRLREMCGNENIIRLKGESYRIPRPTNPTI